MLLKYWHKDQLSSLRLRLHIGVLRIALEAGKASTLARNKQNGHLQMGGFISTCMHAQ